MKDFKDLSLNEKIGQLLLIGFKGHTLSEEIKSMIKEYKFGNFILFSYNIKDLNQLEKLVRDLHNEVIKSLGIIPFIAIDQEGGMILRITDKNTYYPGSMTLASTNSSNAEIIGHMMGKDLLSLGINMKLAPVLDVNNNPKNPIIGIRSYSDNPETVSKFGNLLIKGMQEEGLIATCKHFPGHGDVEMDTHLGLPKLLKISKSLKAF
jgi:beta-N-acetylhexosaminidase